MAKNGLQACGEVQSRSGPRVAGWVGAAEPLARKLLPQAAWPAPNSKVKGVARGPGEGRHKSKGKDHQTWS